MLEGHLIVALSLALVLFLIEVALSVALTSMSALTRVALLRLSEAAPALAFVANVRSPTSMHRLATDVLRGLCLGGGALLLVPVAGFVGSAIASLVVLLAGGLLAQALALWDPRVVFRRMAFLVAASHALLYVAVRPLHLLLARIERRQAEEEEGQEEPEDQEEEVEAFIEVGEREGILEAAEGELIRSIVDLDETLVREIMTPRTDIVAMPEETTVGEARRLLAHEGHSRVPVYRGTIDDVRGVLHVRDVLALGEAGRDGEPVGGHLREVLFVPETLSVAQLLGEMRVKTHMALVVDEYGGVAGLVTLEDLLEEIVGDIRDEHDLEKAEVRREGDGSWVVSASAHVEELEDLFGLDLGERDFDTVGGFVVAAFGRVPSPGEVLSTRGMSIEVLEADRRRIHLVRVRPAQVPKEVPAPS